MIIGMTVVAYGTSTPELAASLAAGPHVTSARKHHRKQHCKHWHGDKERNKE